MLLKMGKFFNLSTISEDEVVLCRDSHTSKLIKLSFQDRLSNVLTLGPAGSGKTFKTMYQSIYQDMKNKKVGFTIIETRGDLSKKIYEMKKTHDRPVIYFNPVDPNCPYFNPLEGEEEEVIDNMVKAYKTLNSNCSTYFQDINEKLLRNSLKILKRLYGNNTTLIDLERLIQNKDRMGLKMVQEFSKLNVESDEIFKENTNIVEWFLSDYLNEKSKTYKDCLGLRSQILKLTSNKHLRKVLNPPNGKSDIDFDKHLEQGDAIVISTAQNYLMGLGKQLGYLIITKLKSAILRRQEGERAVIPHLLYIDNFEEFAMPDFEEILNQSHISQVACHISIQNRKIISMVMGEEKGTQLVDNILKSIKNVVIYSGVSVNDNIYYCEKLGIRDFNLIYRPFNEITYLTVKDGKMQRFGTGQPYLISEKENKKIKKHIFF